MSPTMGFFTRYRAARNRADVALIGANVQQFGTPDREPVRAEIADLREQRDAGSLSDADFAMRVAALLGAAESGLPPLEA